MSFSAEAEEGSTIRVVAPSGATVASVRATGDPQPIELTLPDGEHKLQLTATDAAGNVSSIRSVAVTLDTTPPAAPQVEVVDAPTASKPWTIVQIAGEPRARWALELEGDRQSGTIPSSGRATVDLDAEGSGIIELDLPAVVTPSPGPSLTSRDGARRPPG